MEIPFPRDCEEPFPIDQFNRQDDTEDQKQAHPMISDFTKTGYPYKLHLIFMALSQFLERYGNLPVPKDKVHFFFPILDLFETNRRLKGTT